MITFRLALFDDESTREKLTVMSPMDAMLDDARNEVPIKYWELINNMKPGEFVTMSLYNKGTLRKGAKSWD